MSAVIVAIEGIDGAGKNTQAEMLVEAAKNKGYSAIAFSFPAYADTYFGRLVGKYLNGKFGELQNVHPLLAATLFAGDRFELLRMIKSQNIHERYSLLVFDRYMLSNLVYQSARASGGASRQDEVYNRIWDIERGAYMFPLPKHTVFLDVPVHVAAANVLKKRPRSYTKKAQDLHECAIGYMHRVRKAYLKKLKEHSQTFPNTIVQCTTRVAKKNVMRSPNDIADDVWQTVLPLLVAAK